jgi:hypothetical protein
MQADFIGDESHVVVDSCDMGSRRSIRVRNIPTGYRMNTFSNEAKQDKEIPVKRCAVCCRLLYKEEVCALWKNHQRIIEEQFVQDRRASFAEGVNREVVESMTWPLLNYRDHNGVRIRELDLTATGKHAGAVVVCARHKSGGSQDLNSIIGFVSWIRIR